jgi:hypothetical protein
MSLLQSNFKTTLLSSDYANWLLTGVTLTYYALCDRPRRSKENEKKVGGNFFMYLPINEAQCRTVKTELLLKVRDVSWIILSIETWDSQSRIQLELVKLFLIDTTINYLCTLYLVHRLH